jgi:hypothetical protein
MGLVSFLLLVLTIPAFAERFEHLGDIPTRQNCSTIEAHKIPPDNQIFYQSDAAWCYAYVTADLLSFELGKRVSAADIAFSYNDWNKRYTSKKKHSEMLTGGNPAAAAEVVLDKGMCLENDLHSDLYLIPGKQLTPQNILEGIERNKDLWDRERNGAGLCENFLSAREMFTNVDAKTYAEIILRSKNLETVSNLRDATCKGKRVKMRERLEGVATFGYEVQNGPIQKKMPTVEEQQRRMLSRLDQVLRSKPVAAIVSAPFVGMPVSKGGHVVTVVGRKFNKETLKCEYQIRDSNEICPPGFRCEKDARWTTEDNLLKNLTQINYLREKQP